MTSPEPQAHTDRAPPPPLVCQDLVLKEEVLDWRQILEEMKIDQFY